jgi:hypothetical protein
MHGRSNKQTDSHGDLVCLAYVKLELDSGSPQRDSTHIMDAATDGQTRTEILSVLLIRKTRTRQRIASVRFDSYTHGCMDAATDRQARMVLACVKLKLGSDSPNSPTNLKTNTIPCFLDATKLDK